MDTISKEQADRIEKMLLEIKTHFGIGTNVVKLSDIREQARKDVARARAKHASKTTS